MFSVRCWMFNVPRRLVRRIPPDPIALVDVHRAVFFEANCSAVVRFIPADGVKNELAACRVGALRRRVRFTAIMQRLTMEW